MTSRRSFLSLALGLGAMVETVRAAENHGLAPRTAIALMQAGGLNLYMRHAITDRSQRDTGRRGDRAGQRNLDARGRAQATALGVAFQRLNIRLSAVATSEVFRARDTAELAFGADWVQLLDVLIADDYTPRDARDDALRVRQLLSQPPAADNAMFVGHIIPFGLIVGRSLTQGDFPEGAVALLKPAGSAVSSPAEFLGVVSAEAIITAAGLATPWL